MSCRVFYIVLFISIFLQIKFVSAQSAQALFGQNRIQNKPVNWSRFSSPNFEIFYINGSEELAKRAALLAENEYQRITDLIGYYSFRKTKLIIYKSNKEFSKSNIGLFVDKYQIGGESSYIKNKIEIPFPGNNVDFSKKIQFEVCNLLIKEMVYGSGMKEMIQSSYQISLPDWFILGAAEYCTNGWSEHVDDYVRNISLPKEYKKLKNYREDKARLIGASFWVYLSETYGQNVIANILNLTRLIREEEVAISSTLGMDFYQVFTDWKRFVSKNIQVSEEEFAFNEHSEIYAIEKIKKGKITDFENNNEENKVLISTNDAGKKYIFELDEQNNKVKKLFSSDVKNSTHPQNPDLPLVKWKDNNTATFITGKKGSIFLNVMNGNKKETFNLIGFENIKDYSYSPDGKQVALIGEKDGQSDLFVFTPELNKQFRITNDYYDEKEVLFLSNSKIIFSTNRIKDTLNKLTVLNNYNLYMLDLNSKKVEKLTNTFHNEEKPTKINETEIYYLSNESGINSLYSLNIENKEVTPVSQFSKSIFNYSIYENSLLFSNKNKGNNLYKADLNELQSYIFYKTNRQKIIENRNIQSADVQDIIFRNKEVEKLTKPLPYNLTFSINKLVSGINIDPLVGMGIVFDVTLTDLLENHKFRAGIVGLSDFSSSKSYVEYEFLESRIDYLGHYGRRNIFVSGERNQYKFSEQNAFVTLTYPISFSTAFKVTPRWMQTRLTNFFTPSDDIITNFGGATTELIFDNTVKKGINMLEGTRASVEATVYRGLFKKNGEQIPKNENFNVVNIDLRNYKPILPFLTWANRLAFGKYFGQAPKQFLLGGMDNWFFPKMDFPIDSIKYTADLLYLRYATNMRGFNYNARNGNNFFLFNSEARIYLKKLLNTGNHKSVFINHMQFVVFTDIGTAWTGSNPFDKENSLNKVEYGGDGNAFKITAYNYRSPLLIGYGVGWRTVVLGAFLKLDLAWGVEDYAVKTPKLYVTLGYDF